MKKIVFVFSLACLVSCSSNKPSEADNSAVKTDSLANVDLSKLDTMIKEMHYANLMDSIPNKANTQKELDLILKYISLSKNDTVNAYYAYRAANCYSNMDDFQNCAKYYVKGYENVPEYAMRKEAMLGAGIIYHFQLNDLEKAKALYAQVKKEYPEMTSKVNDVESILGKSDAEIMNDIKSKNK